MIFDYCTVHKFEQNINLSIRVLYVCLVNQIFENCLKIWYSITVRFTILNMIFTLSRFVSVCMSSQSIFQYCLVHKIFELNIPSLYLVYFTVVCLLSSPSIKNSIIASLESSSSPNFEENIQVMTTNSKFEYLFR